MTLLVINVIFNVERRFRRHVEKCCQDVVNVFLGGTVPVCARFSPLFFNLRSRQRQNKENGSNQLKRKIRMGVCVGERESIGSAWDSDSSVTRKLD